MTDPLRCLTLADFNAANFDAYLTHDPASPRVETIEAPFGQALRLLVDPRAPEWAENPDFAVVWTRPEGVIPEFRSLLEGRRVEVAALMRAVDDHIDRLTELAERVRFAFVPTWTLPDRSLFASLDMKPGSGADAALLRMNLRLVERIGAATGLYALNAEAWMRGSQAYSPKLWYLSKTPFANEVFRRAVRAIKAALRGIGGEARKLLVVDLDDTLWGGIVGELGWENLQLGGHDAAGEAFVDFQRTLQALNRRGILLGIVSKNDEAVALEAIRRHPEMVLDLEDFAGWRIDWGDKARNLAELVDELNLGLQSVVFLDDSPAERARVAEALPEVMVPDWPRDPLLYRQALEALDCFDNPELTEEDRERAGLYVVERERRDARRAVGSLEEWLVTLGTKVVMEPLTGANLARAAQLLNKTNQMNLSTRRMSDAELLRWSEAEGHVVWTFRVSDRFGDMGLVGLVGIEAEGDRGRLVDFVLSCRVFGRKVEETMLAVAIREARARGLSEVVAGYRSTSKNRPCLDFLRRSGLDETGGRSFRWPCEAPYAIPDAVQLVEVNDVEDRTGHAEVAEGRARERVP